MMENLINEYYDKSFISSLLCELSYGFYSFLYQCVVFPTILSSSILTIMNSSETNKDIIKIFNIAVNGINFIILAFNSDFELNDKYNQFRTMKIKSSYRNR